MALKVKAVEKKIKFTKNENDPGVWRYVMQPELYIALTQAKVIKEAALRSGVSRGVMKACWDAAGEVIKAWATVEDPDNGENTNTGENQSQGSESQGGNGGSTSQGGDDTGGDNGGGGGDNGDDPDQ